MKPGRLAALLLTSSVLLFLNCIYATFQTPEVTPPGRVAVGLGGAGGITFLGDGGYPTLEADLYTRVGLFPRADAGLRLALPLGLMADFRYQVLRRPLLLTAGLGVQHFTRQGHEFGREVDRAYWNVYPTVLFGSRRVFGGVRAIVVNEDDRLTGRATTRVYPGVLAGASVGGRFRATPEFNLLIGPSSIEDVPRLVTCFGLGLQFTI